MASDIWLRTILIVRKDTRCSHIGYSYRLTARVILYAQDNTYHGLCYTSRGALAGTRNSSIGPTTHHTTSERSTSELRPAPTGARCNPYGYLWSLQIQTYNHSTLYIRTVDSLQWHQLCFVNTKVNDLWHNKLCFVCLLYMGVLQRDPIPKLCFAMVLTICKDFLSWSYR